jgi:hypothetical protein
LNIIFFFWKIDSAGFVRLSTGHTTNYAQSMDVADSTNASVLTTWCYTLSFRLMIMTNLFNFTHCVIGCHFMSFRQVNKKLFRTIHGRFVKFHILLKFARQFNTNIGIIVLKKVLWNYGNSGRYMGRYKLGQPSFTVTCQQKWASCR